MALRDSAEGKPEEAPQPNEAPPPPEGQEPPSAATAAPGAGDRAAAGAGGNPRGRQCGNDAADIAGTWRKRIRIRFRSVIASTTSKRFREEKGLDGTESIRPQRRSPPICHPASGRQDGPACRHIRRGCQRDYTCRHIAVQETSGDSGRSRRQAARSGRDTLWRGLCGLREIARGDQPLNVSGRKIAWQRRQSLICGRPARPDPSHGWHAWGADQEFSDTPGVLVIIVLM